MKYPDVNRDDVVAVERAISACRVVANRRDPSK
jgi:hypothetical protein